MQELKLALFLSLLSLSPAMAGEGHKYDKKEGHHKGQMSSEKKAMYESLMQLPPEEREKAMREFKAKHGMKSEECPDEQGKKMSYMSDSDRAEMERIKQMPEGEERERAIKEFKAKKGMSQSYSKEKKGQMCELDQQSSEKMKKMSPEEREAAVKYIKARKERKIKMENGTVTDGENYIRDSKK